MAPRTALGENALFALERLVGLRPDDSVLLVSDPTADEQVLVALADAVRAVGARHAAVLMPEVLSMGEELPQTVAAALVTADVVLLVSTWFPAWVATRGMWRAMNEYGTRVLHIDPPHRLVLESPVSEDDLAVISDYGRALQRRVRDSTGLLIVDRFGNELRCRIDAHNSHVSSDFPVRFGFAKLPTGVFTVSVVPGTYEGRIVWDAVEGFAMAEGDHIEADVVGGGVRAVRGRGAGKDHVAEKVAVSTAFAQLTEFGVGTNPSVSEERFLREAWHEGANRGAGIVHYGLGSSHAAEGPGGRVPFHTHLVSRNATVYGLPDRVPLVVSGRILAD